MKRLPCLLPLLCLRGAAGLRTGAGPSGGAGSVRAWQPHPLGLTELAAAGGAALNLSRGGLDCVENNGGTCALQNCFSWRGEQTCHLGRCFCTNGQCAGTDGMCHSQRNTLIGSYFRLQNVRWPEYYLYMSNLGGDIWVSKKPGHQGDLEIRRVPNGGRAADPPDFLIASAHFTGYCLDVRESNECDGGSDQRSCTRSYTPRTEHVTFPMETSIKYLAMNFETVPEQPDAVMISSFMYSRHYLYVASMSWQVRTYEHDPGTGGYWRFEPPLPNATMELLRSYHGPRCSFFCGLGRALAPGWALVSLLLALPWLAMRGTAP